MDDRTQMLVCQSFEGLPEVFETGRPPERPPDVCGTSVAKTLAAMLLWDSAQTTESTYLQRQYTKSNMWTLGICQEDNMSMAKEQRKVSIG